MKDLNKVIKNILRSKNVNRGDYLDDDALSDYCAARGLDWLTIHNELEARGYELV